MNADEFTDAVADDNKTALSRLGSSKALYALTEGEMEDAVVLARAADLEHYAVETFDDWAAANEAAEGDAAADAFATAADTARDHNDTVVGKLDDHEPGDEPAIYGVLSGQDGTAARLGGLVGWTTVLGKTTGQLTGYFTGQADPQTSQVFREFGSDLDDVQDAALDALAEDGDWETARAAANEVIQAAYDEYVETLESLGVNPKPVC